RGRPLAERVDDRLRFDLEMFSPRGPAVLDPSESICYDTLHKRPAISKLKQTRLLGRTLLKHLVEPSAAAADQAAERLDQMLEQRATKKRSEEHTSELQSRGHLVCRLLLEKKKN